MRIHGVLEQDVTFVVVACHLAWDAANLNVAGSGSWT